MKRTLLLALVVAFLGACGTDQQDPSSANDSSATLRMDRLHDGGGPIGEEGSVSFARITNADGDVVLEEGFDAPYQGDAYGYPEALEVELEPGSYTLTSYQRSCSGSCEALDPPADDYECKSELTAESGAEVEATVVIERNSCSIRFKR